MKGTVTVGTDEYKKSQSSSPSRGAAARSPTASRLAEAARVQVNLQGEEKRSASSKRLGLEALDQAQEHGAGQVRGNGDLHRRLRQEVRWKISTVVR